MNIHLTVKTDSTLEQALEELSRWHFEESYCIEDVQMGKRLLGGQLPVLPSSLEHSEQTSELALDWHEQWAQFAPHFENGLAHIDLGLRGSLKLAPGGGFGDLSHPTTRLMLQLLKGRCLEQVVLDIGCGSGILTLAAAGLGASHAYGLDIDPLALQHAAYNQQLNDLADKTAFSTAWDKTWKGPPTFILMNMIFSEQQNAWSSQPFNTLITSGILSTQREAYLDWASGQGWTLLEEHREEDWLAFLFT
jgi:ribosomal protein L11 methyltransferase